jgi:predicted RNase H-like HicB family nuclease
MTYKFTTIINKEGKWYVARCVELGVVSQGKTIESAQENLKEAVELYLEDMPKSKKYSIESPALA